MQRSPAVSSGHHGHFEEPGALRHACDLGWGRSSKLHGMQVVPRPSAAFGWGPVELVGYDVASSRPMPPIATNGAKMPSGLPPFRVSFERQRFIDLPITPVQNSIMPVVVIREDSLECIGTAFSVANSVELGHIGATSEGSAADNHGHSWSVIPADQQRHGAAHPGHDDARFAFTRQRPQVRNLSRPPAQTGS
jgi:hypothetical protein